jgi:glutamate--cysteine ligase
MLKELDEQFLIPPLHAGWHVRRKSNHFAAYDRCGDRLRRLIGIDPWLINPDFGVCGRGQLPRAHRRGMPGANVESLLTASAPSTPSTASTSEPFVIVKADAGTYGMGIMTVKDASEVKNLNRKQRNKMAVVKEGLEVTEVIIQEGVPTFETVDEASPSRWST